MGMGLMVGAMFRIMISSFVFLTGIFPAFAWDGYDHQNDAIVEIERGNLVRPGREIEFYDHKAGEYRQLDIDSVYRSGGSVIVEGFDSETGELRELEMDDN